MRRNIILEGNIQKWLGSIDFNALTLKEKAKIIDAVEKMSFITKEDEYESFVTAKLDEMVDAEGNLLDSAQGEFDEYLLGKTLFYVADKDKKYELAVKKLFEKLFNGKRSMGTETCAGIYSENIGEALKTQPFYMNYESKYGGKEHYNDVIAQFNILAGQLYEKEAAKIGDFEAEKNVIDFAAAAIDTSDVCEQALYEIFDRLKRIFKTAVLDLNAKASFLNNENAWVDEDKCTDKAVLTYAYAVLKACRMKTLHTEKYAFIAERILNCAVKKAEADFWQFGSTEDKACLTGLYAEALRNREYQDYGRDNGGRLWN